MQISLTLYGWNDDRERQLNNLAWHDVVAGRVAVDHGFIYTILTEDGEVQAEITGELRHSARPGELPVAGDWIALAPNPGGPALIRAVLPRTSAFTRKVAGATTQEQVVAANIDRAVIVFPSDIPLKENKLERYLTQVWSSGATPVVALTKRDLAFDDGVFDMARRTALGVDVFWVSNTAGLGIDELSSSLTPGITACVIGPSGAGKSSLVNALAGREVLTTRSIREDGKGRHTTTHRELVLLPSGAIVIDSPGIRELQLWDAADGLDETFTDITSLAEKCRFRDCSHRDEPGCAVKAAIAAGRLEERRLASFVKLKRELVALELKKDKRASSERKRAIRRQARQRRSKAGWA